MTIIKAANNRIRFEQPIVLNPDKKYKLGVSHQMFSIKQSFFINNFTFDFFVPISAGNEDTVTAMIHGNFTIKALQKEIQDKTNYWFNVLIKQYEGQKKKEIVDKLKKIPTAFKLDVEKEKENKYVMKITFPFRTKIITDGGFCRIFGFEDYIRVVLKAGEQYISKNIIDLFKPLSVIEWHCNIVEYSYANHDDHPHIHKQEELLHISFVDNNFYEKPVYKASPEKIMFIPLRNGLREIKEIVLTPQDEKCQEIKNLKNVVVYLQLKEE